MTCHRYLDFDRERGSSKLPKVFAVSTAKSVADFSDVARLGEEFAAWDCRETSALGLSIGDLLGFQHDYRITVTVHFTLSTSICRTSRAYPTSLRRIRASHHLRRRDGKPLGLR